MAETLGDGPIEQQYRATMNAIAQVIDEQLNPGKTTMPGLPAAKRQPRKVGFVLMVFPFGDHYDGRCNYISNGADRRDVVILMKEMIARFEGQPEVSGRG